MSVLSPSHLHGNRALNTHRGNPTRKRDAVCGLEDLYSIQEHELEVKLNDDIDVRGARLVRAKLDVSPPQPFLADAQPRNTIRPIAHDPLAHRLAEPRPNGLTDLLLEFRGRLFANRGVARRAATASHAASAPHHGVIESPRNHIRHGSKANPTEWIVINKKRKPADH